MADWNHLPVVSQRPSPDGVHAIGASVSIRGDVSASADLTIEGTVKGPIVTKDAVLTIASGGRVDGNLRARSVVVSGRVRGNVSATERIVLTATAQVTGDLSADIVVLTDGANFHGRIDMNQRTIAAKVAQFRLAQGTPPPSARP